MLSPPFVQSGSGQMVNGAHLALTVLENSLGNYEAALHTLVEGSVLAVIVVLLFLRNWRATLISAVALPLSAIIFVALSSSLLTAVPLTLPVPVTAQSTTPRSNAL